MIFAIDSWVFGKISAINLTLFVTASLACRWDEIQKSQRNSLFTAIKLTLEFAFFRATAWCIIILASGFDAYVASNYYREYSVDVLKRRPSLTRIWRHTDTWWRDWRIETGRAIFLHLKWKIHTRTTAMLDKSNISNKPPHTPPHPTHNPVLFRETHKRLFYVEGRMHKSVKWISSKLWSLWSEEVCNFVELTSHVQKNNQLWLPLIYLCCSFWKVKCRMRRRDV